FATIRPLPSSPLFPYTTLFRSRATEQITGTVSIGLASSTARILALPLMQRVKVELPGIVLEIVDVPSADLTKLVLQGRIDFSLSDRKSTRLNSSHVKISYAVFC